MEREREHERTRAREQERDADYAGLLATFDEQLHALETAIDAGDLAAARRVRERLAALRDRLRGLFGLD